MLICPQCRTRMNLEIRGRIRTWCCPDCHSHTATLAVLRQLAKPGLLESYWDRIWKDQGIPGKSCPSCRSAMTAVSQVVEGMNLELDGCRSCQIFWFDEGELRAVSPNLGPALTISSDQDDPPTGKVPTVPVEYQYETVPEGWMYAAGVLGLPVEVDIPSVRIKPWATWILAGAIVLGGIITIETGPALAAEDYGLVPARLLRKGGLTMVSSFFIHGGPVHFLSNLYFLLVFGDNVEEALGWRRYLVLVGAATIAGGLAHAAMSPGSTVPCIGASGGISGILACYAFLFPRGQIAILGFFLFWIRIPVILGLCLWLGMQIFLAYQQSAGRTNVAAIAHLGGLAVGLGVWALWLRGRRGRAGE